MVYEIQQGQVNTEPVLPLGPEIAQLPSLAPWATTIPAQRKDYIYPKFYYAKCPIL